MKALAVFLALQTAAVAAQSNTTVRVAAIQCPSVMGRTESNLRTITHLVQRAAAAGAKIIVTPECAVQGYLDPTTWTAWSTATGSVLSVQRVAETVPGPSSRVLARLADELNIYLCVGMIEAESNSFYNAQLLFAPDGSMAAHHRKKSLWTPGDSTWCTPGLLPVQVVPTEFGNLGLMVCYDFHTLPPHLAARNADIVLYSVGWYGPNEEDWFGRQFPAKVVVPYGFAVVAANWSSRTAETGWPGCGHSCIIDANGRAISMSKSVAGSDIVVADLLIRKRR